MEIVIACGNGGPPYSWVDSDVEKGIGGSEECVILLSRELAKLGHKVVVYNNCGSRAGRYNGVEYRNYAFYDKLPPTDVIIAWRNWYLLIGKQAKHKWLWCHDIPVGCHCPCQEEIDRPDSAFNHIDKFALSNGYHRSLYHHIPDDKIFICPVGTDLSVFDVPVERISGRVLYFSHPHRGLERLRAIWPDIKAAVPHATLAAFWWEPEFWLPANEALGILPMSKLGYRDVAAECLRADIFGYPSTFAPETFSAASLKAQIGGAIPVVVIQGGMVDTVQYGVKTSHEYYAQELISALKMSAAGDLDAERVEMMTRMRENYSWESVARRWEAELSNDS